MTDTMQGLNKEQLDAVQTINGPMLILAGAGSGKTKVLTCRIAHLLQQGVRPYRILAITFTNKAAAEMRERVDRMAGAAARDVWLFTFHAFCARLLRYELENLNGYANNFAIYDTSDSKNLIKQVLKEMNLDEKRFPLPAIISHISNAKNALLLPDAYAREASGYYEQQVAKIYDAYQKKLQANNAVDFDDLLLLALRLLQENPAVREKYQRKFDYLMVDEYQDTNHAQYLLTKLLAAGHRNICVVGDADQSIYGWRGADIQNILDFEKDYPDAKLVKLEQNYRSTQVILDAANAVIDNNSGRKPKNLWTANGNGSEIIYYQANDERDEARYVIENMQKLQLNEGAKLGDMAVLYRTNAQSRVFEEMLIKSGIAYTMVGGTKFYERKEIKDIIAYLSVINNHSDAIRLKRIINEPKRGIGDATVDKAQEIADMLGVPLFEILERAEEFQPLAKKCKPLMEFAQMLNELGQIAENGSLEELFDELLERTGYLIHLRAMGDEGINRIENVNELKTNIIKYVEEMEKLPQPSIDPDHPDEEPEIMMPSLEGFLEEVTLYTDLDGYEEDADRVIMMTMHSAKGLEFDNVFFCGAEEGIFPGIQAIYNPDQIEEERRLAYVCITRAKKKLYITNAAQRMIFGQTVRNRVSRFVTEIPAACCDVEDKTIRKASAAELKKAQPKKTRAVNDIGVGGLGAAKKTIAYSSDAPTGAACTLKAGDRVSHKTFGEGNILKITPMGGDCLLEVKFDQIGVKKIMYKFAHLTKLS